MRLKDRTSKESEHILLQERMLERETKVLIERDMKVQDRIRRANEKERELEVQERKLQLRELEIQKDRDRIENLLRGCNEMMLQIRQEKYELDNRGAKPGNEQKVNVKSEEPSIIDYVHGGFPVEMYDDDDDDDGDDSSDFSRWGGVDDYKILKFPWSAKTQTSQGVKETKFKIIKCPPTACTQTDQIINADLKEKDLKQMVDSLSHNVPRITYFLA